MYPRGHNTIRKILVTAGPTIEPLDPVRFISNYSTGRTGYLMAKEAARCGFKVLLVSGPVNLPNPAGVKVVKVATAHEMQTSVTRFIKDYDCIIMTSAVCDFRPEARKISKIKKKKRITIKLVENPDILLGLRKRKNLVRVGFALESSKLIKNAKAKLEKKNLDMIVATTIGKNSNPFGNSAPSRYVLVDKKNRIEELHKYSKERLAKLIVRKVKALLE